MKEKSLVGFPLGILKRIDIPRFINGFVKSIEKGYFGINSKRVALSVVVFHLIVAFYTNTFPINVL